MWGLASGLVARGREEAANDYCRWFSLLLAAFWGKPFSESDLRQFAKEQDIPDYAISKIIHSMKNAKILMN